jgi:hypothetical protein
MSEEKGYPTDLSSETLARNDEGIDKVPDRKNPLQVLLRSAGRVRDFVTESRRRYYGDERAREIASGLDASQQQRRLNIGQKIAIYLGLGAPGFATAAGICESMIGNSGWENSAWIGSLVELGVTAAAIGLGATAKYIEEKKQNAGVVAGKDNGGTDTGG